jgi:AcrR family transcriptional regulator
MRNLAQELDTAPMSLYRHFANKEELLDGMIDVVFSEIYSPVIGGAWKTELRKRGMSVREGLLRHPWAVGLMETRMSPGPASAEHHNATLGCLREAGFPFRDAVHAYTLLDAYTYGFALQEKTIPFETPEQSAEMAKVTVGDRGGVSTPTLRRSLSSSRPRLATATPKSSRSVSTSSSMGSNDSRENDPF